jgi:hypothetical protein
LITDVPTSQTQQAQWGKKGGYQVTVGVAETEAVVVAAIIAADIAVVVAAANTAAAFAIAFVAVAVESIVLMLMVVSAVARVVEGEKRIILGQEGVRLQIEEVEQTNQVVGC